MFTKENLMTAGLATIAGMLGANFTAGQGKLTQGAVIFGLTLGALILAKKL